MITYKDLSDLISSTLPSGSGVHTKGHWLSHWAIILSFSNPYSKITQSQLYFEHLITIYDVP